MKKLFVLFVFLFFLASVILLFAEKRTISGTVTEKNSGEAVRGITVSLYTDSTAKTAFRGAYTNKFGFYSIPDVNPGDYWITVSGVGYQKYGISISLKDTGDIRIDFGISAGDVRTQEITVESERETGPTKNISAVEVSPEMIKSLPSIIGEPDLFRALQLLPGVQSSTELSSGLYVRGGSPDQNLTLLDGVIIYNSSHIGGLLSSFNTDAIRDVRLIKGAFPAEYGSRLSSVLDLTMKEGTREKLSGSGGISLLSSRLTLEGPITENSTFMVSGRRMYLDLLTSIMYSDDEDIPSYYFYDLNLKTNLRISENDRLYFSGYFGADVFGVEDNNEYYDGEEFRDETSTFDMDWGNKIGNIRWMHIVDPQLFTNFSLIYTDYSFNTEMAEGRDQNFNSISRIRDIMIRMNAEYFPGENHRIKTGLEGTWHNFKSEISTRIFEDWELPFNPSKEADAFEIALYGQDEWTISDRLTANIGARMFWFEEAKYFDFEPRLSAVYDWIDDIKLKGAFSIVNQPVHLMVRNDITLPTDLWFPSTETVHPSKSWQAVLGAERSFLDGEYLISIEGYYKKMTNLYEYKEGALFTFGIPIEEQFTAGEGEAYGVEFFINKRIGSVTGWIGYTLAWTTRQFDEINGGREFYPRYDRRHDIKIVATYELSDSWEIGASWVYGTGQAYTMPVGTYSFSYHDYDPPDDNNIFMNERYLFAERNNWRLPAFHKLDVNLVHKYEWFGIPFSWSLNFYNLYNRKNPFAWYIDYDWDADSFQTSNKVVKQLTLFPLIITTGLSFSF